MTAGPLTARGLRCFSCPPGIGYGDAACGYLKGWAELGIPLRWSPVPEQPYAPLDLAGLEPLLAPGFLTALAPALRREADNWSGYDTVLLELPPSRASYGPIRRRESSCRQFAYVAWELDVLPPQWWELFDGLDAVFVPSRFTRDALMAAGITQPVHRAPHVARITSTEQRAATDAPADWPEALRDRFVFYTIGTMTSRKGIELTVEAFLRAFTRDDNVALVVKTSGIDYMRLCTLSRELGEEAVTDPRINSWHRIAGLLSRYPDHAPVHLVTEQESAVKVDALHRAADCFVSLTRSEGWGLGAFEALQFGNPVVMTGHGGQRDYLGADHPLAVSYEVEPLGNTERDGYYRDTPLGHWARPDLDHAATRLRAVYEAPGSYREWARQRGEAIRREFAAGRVCAAMAGIMGLLEGSAAAS